MSKPNTTLEHMLKAPAWPGTARTVLDAIGPDLPSVLSDKSPAAVRLRLGELLLVVGVQQPVIELVSTLKAPELC